MAKFWLADFRLTHVNPKKHDFARTEFFAPPVVVISFMETDIDPGGQSCTQESTLIFPEFLSFPAMKQFPFSFNLTD